MDFKTARRKLYFSLAAQNFRFVDLSTLIMPNPINLSSVPGDLAEALRGAQRDSTDWRRIGEQLAILRDGLNQDGKYLAFLAVATAGIDPELASTLRKSGYMPGQVGWGAQPIMDGIGWDCRATSFQPDSLYFTRCAVVDDHRLKQGLAV
ncbi:hypothetical protein MPY17_13945 [Rhodococcus opacus]|uniref:hypothetical protein n=1 Tax=Rhodococcus opacus TaxID=37919 RepID=UPI001FF4DE17|nr:hypothetical protein [Rhodococcus opacus]UOT06771.1 hypothetical protein MPY17_13945 [Rhodococcus opacus]